MSNTDLMQADSEDAIRVLRLPTQLQDLSVVVPYSLVAEITEVNLKDSEGRLARNKVVLVEWRGQVIPLISLELLNGEALPTIGQRIRVAVLYNTDPDLALAYYAVLLSGVPRSERVRMDEVNATGTLDDSIWRYVVKMQDRLTAIPDIRSIERIVDHMRLHNTSPDVPDYEAF